LRSGLADFLPPVARRCPDFGKIWAMTTLTARARALWETMAGTPVEFAAAVAVAVSARSRLSPPGWTGTVVIDNAAIAVAPDQGTAREVQRALDGLPAASLTDAGLLSARLRISQVLGPAALAYLDGADFCPRDGSARTEVLNPNDPDLGEFLAAEDQAEVEESGMRRITSPAFAVRERGQIAAVAGYCDWPGRTAHFCVFTSASARGRGLARIASSAAVRHALREGMLPQWRARLESSKRVAAALGFRELGAQLSICVIAVRPDAGWSTRR
jgi:GNAT superfamily N-acetyltransferase